MFQRGTASARSTSDQYQRVPALSSNSFEVQDDTPLLSRSIRAEPQGSIKSFGSTFGFGYGTPPGLSVQPIRRVSFNDAVELQNMPSTTAYVPAFSTFGQPPMVTQHSDGSRADANGAEPFENIAITIDPSARSARASESGVAANTGTAGAVMHNAAGDLHMPCPNAPAALKVPQRQDSLLHEFVEDAPEAQTVPPMAARIRFIFTCLPVLFTLFFLVAGTLLYTNKDHVKAFEMQEWRWCFFLAGICPIWYFAELLVRVMVFVVESQFFTTPQAMYFTVSIRGPAARLLRSIFLIPLFVLTFQDKKDSPAAVTAAWSTLIKVLICIVLAASADLLKVLCAKMMASHFHRKAHFEKMQDAINKEFVLHSLSQPRRAQRSSSAGMSLLSQKERSFWDDFTNSTRNMSSAVLTTVGTLNENLRRRMHQAAVKAHLSSQSTARSTSKPFDFSDKHSQKIRLQSRTSMAGSDFGSPTSMAAEHRDKEYQQMKPSNNSPTAASPGFKDGMARAPPELREMSNQNISRKAFLPQPVDPMAEPLMDPDDNDFMRKLHAFEEHLRENKLKMTFTEQMGSAAEDHVNSKKEAKKLAFYLFWNLRPCHDRDHVCLDDLEQLLPKERAAKALKVLDVDGDGKVSLHDMRDAVIQIYNERKNLAFTLKDTWTVVGKLEFVIGISIHLLFGFFYLLIFEVNVAQVWLSFSSVILAFTFIFGASLQRMYENVIFLFVVHPYDVGDALMIDGVWHSVVEISLQTTAIVRWDGIKLWVPNSKIRAGEVANISSSQNRWEGFKVMVDIHTTSEQFDALDKHVTAFLNSKPASYTGAHLTCANFAGDPLKFTLCVFWEFAHPGIELGRMARDRHGLYMNICEALRAVGVHYTLPRYEMAGPMPAASSAAANPFPERPVGEGQPFMPSFMQPAGQRI